MFEFYRTKLGTDEATELAGAEELTRSLSVFLFLAPLLSYLSSLFFRTACSSSHPRCEKPSTCEFLTSGSKSRNSKVLEPTPKTSWCSTRKSRDKSR